MHDIIQNVIVQFLCYWCLMKPTIPQLEQYLADALGIKIAPGPWRGSNQLPHFLRESYTFFQVKLLELSCILAIDDNPAETPPAALRKHVDLVQSTQDIPVIYVRSRITAYNRKRLIEHKVPFIVPGNQMYLPMLAIDLREHFRRVRSGVSKFSPATQSVVIHALVQEKNEGFTPSTLAAQLGFSAMTVSRAFDELEAAGLGLATIRGRERYLCIADNRKKTWEQAQPFLRSPTRKRLFVHYDGPIGGVEAGLNALAHYSMLAPPAYATHAISREQWRQIHHHKMIQVPWADPNGQEIQVWVYPPALFAYKKIVDPLSLFLSLKDDPDERTQMALDEMMENHQW